MKDLLVVGGGPAGLVSGLAARRAGLEVTVLERRTPPLDKPCGEGLMPLGVRVLTELGVPLPSSALPFRGIRYLDEASVAQADLPRPGLGLRRPELHRTLLQEAERAGVEVEHGCRVEGAERGGDLWRVKTSRGERRARWLVGADGLRSSVRGWAGLEGRPAGRPRFGMRRHFSCRPWTDCVEVYWSDVGEAYVTPVGAQEVGVALLWSGIRSPFPRLLEHFPALQAALGSAPPSTPVLGTGPLRQRTRGVVGPGLALVGDAGGYLDAITGEGLSLAFLQAQRLAAALAGGDLRPYAKAWRRDRRGADFLTHLALLLSARPRLRRRVLERFAAEPDLFRRLLAIHAGEAPLRSLGPRGALRLAGCLI